MHEGEFLHRGLFQFGILFRLRGLEELGRVAREEERLQNLPANMGGSLRLVQLLQFACAVDQAELTDGFAAQRLVFFTLGCGEKALVIAADHVAAKNGVLHRSIVARGINLGERLARFSTTEDSQVFDRFTLQLGIALPARDSSENLAGLRRAALRHYKERFGLVPRRPRTV